MLITIKRRAIKNDERNSEMNNRSIIKKQQQSLMIYKKNKIKSCDILLSNNNTDEISIQYLCYGFTSIMNTVQ